MCEMPPATAIAAKNLSTTPPGRVVDGKAGGEKSPSAAPLTTLPKIPPPSELSPEPMRRRVGRPAMRWLDAEEIGALIEWPASLIEPMLRARRPFFSRAAERWSETRGCVCWQAPQSDVELFLRVPKLEPWVSVETAALLRDVSENKIREMIKDHRLRAERFGKDVRIPVTALCAVHRAQPSARALSFFSQVKRSGKQPRAAEVLA
jgi:excisionase family DNA binding protein